MPSQRSDPTVTPEVEDFTRPKDPARLTLANALAELDAMATEAPFLALGQTIFWDEPMKAGVALGARKLGNPRQLIAGVHDTDYFAKVASSAVRPGQFKALPHNDTTTQGLWSAAGEFSALFGSETVITRDTLAAAGLRTNGLAKARPGFLDEATEAWHWRGIASLDEVAPITADVPLPQLLPQLMNTLDWALERSVEILAGGGHETAQTLAHELRTAVCDASDEEGLSVADFYERLLPTLYNFGANANVPIDTSRTSHLLRFNRETAHLPRFEIVDLFIRPETQAMAKTAYNQAAAPAPGIYELSRFGTGAIPFDLVIPGHGRGTVRIGKRGVVINTPVPRFISLAKPLKSAQELAGLIEAKFGPNCALVGKAVALIGMLAREFVFVFHEGASSYVKYSRLMHRAFATSGHPLALNPILRVRYDTWEAFRVCCSWMRLPEPLRGPFGTEELCAPSFAARWQEVGRDQERLLTRLGELRRPVELIEFLDTSVGGAWSSLAKEYGSLHTRLSALEQALGKVQAHRKELYQQVRRLQTARIEAEIAKGQHWREKMFEKSPSPADFAERERLTAAIEATQHKRALVEQNIHELRREQNTLVNDAEIQRIHERRRSIELEAELKRLRLIRNAVISSRGLHKASLRPSAWWFRLVCPDGLWFRETVNSAEYYLEPLQ